MADPVITSISPSGGSVDGGTTVTITGTALGTPTAVTFGTTAATSFVGQSATRAYAVAPAGTGTVHVTLTTAEGTSATSAADQFTYGDVLFTVAEARAFDKAQLASTTDYTDAEITAKHDEIREWLERVCGVNFLPTTHTDEYHDGDGSQYLMLDWPLATSITAASTRDDSTWTALTADELADLHIRRNSVLNEVYREGSYWPRGIDNLKVTYVAGHSTVPDLVKRAALQIVVLELPSAPISPVANSYEDGVANYSWTRGDGYNGNWSALPDVVKCIRLYGMLPPGIA